MIKGHAKEDYILLKDHINYGPIHGEWASFYISPIILHEGVNPKTLNLHYFYSGGYKNIIYTRFCAVELINLAGINTPSAMKSFPFPFPLTAAIIYFGHDATIRGEYTIFKPGFWGIGEAFWNGPVGSSMYSAAACHALHHAGIDASWNKKARKCSLYDLEVW